MPEIRPRLGRELKVDDLKAGLRVVIMQPRHPGYSVMDIMDLTNTTMRLFGRELPQMGHRVGITMLCRLRPDGYVEDWGGRILHVFKCLEPPEDPKPTMPRYLPTDSPEIGRELKADELQTNTKVIINQPGAPDVYLIMEVLYVDEQTVDLSFLMKAPVRLPLCVQPDKTLRNPRGDTVKLFEYLGHP